MIRAIVLIRTDTYAPLEQVVLALRSTSSVLSAGAYFGAYSIVVTIEGTDLNDIAFTVIHQIQKIMGIRETETLIEIDLHQIQPLSEP